ncbi:MAG: LysR family transcriptional regulator [Verrucomicrobia bacterium]|nr:LysR family transcriptional regulator [Verrucomicrobiota bacterium]
MIRHAWFALAIRSDNNGLPMQVESFRVFRDLVETRSFSRSASLNGITQSAVSQQLRSIEVRLRVPLLERTSKQFALTREGQLLYEASREIIGYYQRFQHQLEEMRNIISGTIRLVAVPSLGLHELPPYIKDFLKAFPQVKIQVDYRRSNEVYESVAAGDADVGFVAFPSPRKGLKVETFKKDTLHIICAPGHPLLKKGPVDLAQLGQTKIISLAPEMPTRQGLDRILATRGLKFQPMMEFDNVETLKQAVEINAGVAFLPASAVASELAKGSLAILPHLGKEIVRPLGIVFRASRMVSPAVKRFLKALKTPRECPPR